MLPSPSRQAVVTALLGAPRRRWYAFFPALALGTGLIALAPVVLRGSARAPEALTWGWAAAGALIIAALVALVLDLCDPRLRQVRQIEGTLRWPVLAELPWLPHGADGAGLGDLRGTYEKGVFDHLALRVAQLAQLYQQRAFTLLSQSHGEGTSLASSQLAAALARGGHRVILVDGDLARAGADAERAGFTDLLAEDPSRDEMSARRTLIASRPTGLQLLAAGSVPAPQDPEAIRNRARAVLLGLRRLADFVVCDGGTIDGGGAAVGPLATAADACLLVLEAERTDAEGALTIRRTLLEGGARVAGVIVTPKHVHRTERRRATGRRTARTEPPRPAAVHRK